MYKSFWRKKFLQMTFFDGVPESESFWKRVDFLQHSSAIKKNSIREGTTRDILTMSNDNMTNAPRALIRDRVRRHTGGFVFHARLNR